MFKINQSKVGNHQVVKVVDGKEYAYLSSSSKESAKEYLDELLGVYQNQTPYKVTITEGERKLELFIPARNRAAAHHTANEFIRLHMKELGNHAMTVEPYQLK